ncbi:MAG: hypothetical protein IPJ40_07865 [Saprospirales bacterium]|nr:hypothetical protein [Saprospirales bacterium]
MKHPYLWSPLFFLLLLFNWQKQPDPDTYYCASDFINHQYQLAHPEVGQLQQNLEKSYRQSNLGDQPEAFPYTLPVVFHVIPQQRPRKPARRSSVAGPSTPQRGF